MTSYGPPAGSGYKSEKNLQCQLANPGVTRPKDQTERARAEVPVRVEKLGMVEDIEELGPELSTHVFRDLGVFQQGQIEVIDTWPMEESPIGSVQGAQTFEAECRCIEVGLARSGISKV
jgi:hypothetical protein